MMTTIIDKLSSENICLSHSYEEGTTSIKMTSGPTSFELYMNAGDVGSLLKLKTNRAYISGGNSFISMYKDNQNLHIACSVNGCGGDCYTEIKLNVDYTDEFVDYVVDAIRLCPSD